MQKELRKTITKTKPTVKSDFFEKIVHEKTYIRKKGPRAKVLFLTCGFKDIYNIEDESLNKRSRGLYNIFESVIKYEQVYVCTIKNKNYGNEKSNNVFRCLRFKNNLNRLLGAGPVSIVDNTKKMHSPIAQSKLDYTPKNDYGFIQLTETFDIQVDQDKTSNKIKDGTIKFGYKNYQKTKVTLITHLVNFKDEKVDLLIKQEIDGEIKNGSSGNISKSKDYLHTPNSKYYVEWNIKLKPHEKKEFKFDYYYYIY